MPSFASATSSNPPLTNLVPNRCFSTLGAPQSSWLEVLEFARQSGLNAVEIRCLDGQVVEPSKFGALLPSVDQARQDLKEYGLSLAMLGTSVKLLDRTDIELEKLTAFAQLADQLDCPWLRIFDGGTIGESPSQSTFQQTRVFLETWAKLRDDHGFRCDIAVETHDAMANLRTSRAILEALPHFHVLWDTHHTWRNGEGLLEYYLLVKERTVHYHVKDSVDRPSKRKPFTYVEPGTGEFPWPALGELLRERKPNAQISFEWEQHWNPELADIEDVMPAFLRQTNNWA